MIQTVTGKIEGSEIGCVLMHEHISCSSVACVNAFSGRWLDKERLKTLSVETLSLAKQKYGLGLIVDGTPIDLGRDGAILKEISELSGVRMVASTGFYYLQSIETKSNSPEELAHWLIEEFENGIAGTDIKPGILKCATGEHGITLDNLTKLSAVGIAQSVTGLPLYVHCEHRGDIAFKQIEALIKSGAEIKKIIIGHTAMRPGIEYLESILKTGCYISMDQCHCYPGRIDEIAKALVFLCSKGYSDKILISNDHCIHSDFARRDKNGLHLSATQHADGLGYVFDHLKSKYMEFGGQSNDWNAITSKNPIEVLDI